MFHSEIYRKGKGHIVMYSCPLCKGIVKEEKTKYSQGVRILFLIIGVPAGMFALVAFIVIARDLVPQFIFGVDTAYIIGLLLFLLIIVARVFGKKIFSNKLILGEETNIMKIPNIETASSAAKVEPSGDSLMDSIRQNAQKPTVDKTKTKSVGRKLYIALAVLISLATFYIIYLPEFRSLYGQVSSSNNKMKEAIIQGRAEGIMRDLELLRDKDGVYPETIDTEHFRTMYDIVFLKDTLEMEKDYFGRTIDFDDFNYEYHKKSYRLCISDEFGGMCWTNKR